MPINAIEIDVTDLDGLEVRREWRNLDLLLVEKDKKILIVIENKIDSSEGDNQLKTYSKRVNSLYPEYRKLKIFLTPEGREPSQDDWLPYSYREIQNQLEKIIESKKTVVGDEILSLVTHYNEMLRRHILTDSEIIELCQTIYKNHKDALDLIFENKPDLQLDLSEYLQEKVKEDQELNSDTSSKTYIRFSLPAWDQFDVQSTGSGWTESGNILLFEFRNYETSLGLSLIIGPGPDKIRKDLYQTAVDNQDKLEAPRKSLTSKWTQIHKVPILSKKDYEDPDFDELCNQIDRFWANRLFKEVEKIKPIFKEPFSSFDSA